MNVEQRQALIKAVNKLNSMPDGGDPERLHEDAEDILFDLLAEFGAEAAAQAFERASDRVGFWHA